MDRLTAYLSYKTHPWLSKSFKRLKSDEIDLGVQFIKANENLDKDAFDKAINRMFLDRPKPKHWATILELLANANSAC